MNVMCLIIQCLTCLLLAFPSGYVSLDLYLVLASFWFEVMGIDIAFVSTIYLEKRD